MPATSTSRVPIRNTLSYKNESLPLPMENDPQLVFERLFGDGTTDAQRRERRAQSASILDSIGSQVSQLQRGISATDRARMDDYLQEVREIERRVQRVSEKLTGDVLLPDAPAGAPPSFEAHVDLMFDLQVLAFKTEITRVATFMMAREQFQHPLCRQWRLGGFHNASHHSNERKNREQFALINAFHADLIAKFLAKLKQTPDGEHDMLHNSDGALWRRHERRQRAQFRPAARHPRRQCRRTIARQSTSVVCAAHADVQSPARHVAQAGRARRQIRRRR